jgi:hypothetical protein
MLLMRTRKQRGIELPVDRVSVVGIATRAAGWTVWGSNLGGGEIFRTRTDRPWGRTQPPVQRVPGLLPGGKAAGA